MPSALTCPALGMPTIMPNCCCTVGSDAVGSMRPNSSGGPLYLSRSGRKDDALTVSGRKLQWRAGAHRAGLFRPVRTVWRDQRVATPLKARARAMYWRTTSAQVVRPDVMAWCRSSIVASSTRNDVSDDCGIASACFIPAADRADFSINCTPRRCLRGIRSQGCAKRTAFGGDRFAVVLEFEFLSGKMVACNQWGLGAASSAVSTAQPRQSPIAS